MSHLSSLYQLVKTERRLFQINRKCMDLSQQCEQQKRNFCFSFAFYFSCLLYIIKISISVSKLLHFRRIILNRITENVDIDIDNQITLILIFIRKLFGHFLKRWPKMNTKSETKLWKFDSIRKLPFVWKI